MTVSDPYSYVATPVPTTAPGYVTQLAAGHCVKCGSSPAVPTVFKRHSGFVILSRTWTERATYCAGCAKAAYRRCQVWNLTLGWWGVISAMLNVGCLLGNAKQMRTLSSS